MLHARIKLTRASNGRARQILGRADDLSQFLKYGAKEAYVELELKGSAGERNLVIKRTLGKDSNKSKMEMNGVYLGPCFALFDVSGC